MIRTLNKGTFSLLLGAALQGGGGGAQVVDRPHKLLGNPTQCYDKPGGTKGDCGPGFECCGDPFENAPQYHLIDQQGCAENDPNGPVFDPVHGVFHHFYQIHLASPQGGDGYGPDYGHFVSKNLIEWAALPVAIWNGIDKTAGETKYDTVAIYTGSATLVPGAGPDGADGIVQIYPGLCTGDAWPGCDSGTLLAMARPADYAGDELLVNWTKSGVIVNNTERDPSTAWKTSAGEWRLRTYDSMVYGAASDEDLLAGSWYTIGQSDSLRTCECPSLYELPAATPGSSAHDSSLPTHVHKTSCGGDWWQLGNYVEGAPKVLGNFSAAPGWEAEFEQSEIDVGQFYASKDVDYPALDGSHRRINYGWATVPPQSAQSLPREITFNADARLLQQYPIEEIEQLRRAPAVNDSATVDGSYDVSVPENVTRQSELLVVFDLPDDSATLGVTVGDLVCSVSYDPSKLSGGADYVDCDASCGSTDDDTNDFTVRLLASESTLELRLFADWTFAETYFQRGRAAVTSTSAFDATSAISLQASTPTTAAVRVFPMKGIFVDEATVRKTERVYAWSD